MFLPPLPYWSFEIQTTASPQAIVEWLEVWAQPGFFVRPQELWLGWKWIGWGWDPWKSYEGHKEFWGVVDESGFKLMRFSPGSWLGMPSPFACMHGRFEPGPEGTTVVVKMFPLLRFLILLAIPLLLGGVCCGPCMFGLSWFEQPWVSLPSVSIYLFFAFTIICVWFWIGATGSKRRLEGLVAKFSPPPTAEEGPQPDR